MSHELARINGVNVLPQGIDFSLYLVINADDLTARNCVQLALDAIDGGVSAIQIRSKSLSRKNYTALVSQVARALEPCNIPVFVNDDVAVAKDVATDCIHLGQNDVPVHTARNLLGDSASIGLTVRSVDEAKSAPLDELSYISVGGIYPTNSKSDTCSPIGIEGLNQVVRVLASRRPKVPVIAISGINSSNVQSVLDTGVDGVAVVAAICEAQNPKLAARQLRTIIDRSLAIRGQ